MFDLNDLISDYFIENLSCLYNDIIGNIFYSSESYTRQRLLGNYFEYVLSEELYQITGIYKLTFYEMEDACVGSLFDVLEEHHLLDSCSHFDVDNISDLCLYGNLDMLIHYGVNYVEKSVDFLNSKFSLYLLEDDCGYLCNDINLLNDLNLNLLFQTQIKNLDFDKFLSFLPVDFYLRLNPKYLNRLLSSLNNSYSHNLFLIEILSFLSHGCDLSVCDYFKNVYLYYSNYSLYFYSYKNPSYKELIDMISNINSSSITNFKLLYMSEYKDLLEAEAPEDIKSLLSPHLFTPNELGLREDD